MHSSPHDQAPATPQPSADAPHADTPHAGAPARFCARVRLLTRRAGADDRGSVTAEYAVATMAAVGFAGLLVVILRGDEVRGILTELVRNALSIAG